MKEIAVFQDIDIIQTEKGGYRFQPEVETIIDTTIFEQEYEKIEKQQTYNGGCGHSCKNSHRFI